MLQMAGRMGVLGTETAFEVLARANALAAQGRSIINLGIGQPDFPTPDHIVEAGRKALADGHHGYTPANGIPPLRAAVAADLWRRHRVEVSPDQVLEKITPKTRLLIINSPANPTGGVVPKAELDRLVAGLERHPHVAVMSDEIYGEILYDGAEHVSLLGYPELRDRLILLDGWSKTYAMTGWRMGYGVWPKAVFADAERLAINCHSCVNASAQYAGIAALQGPREPVHRMVKAFAERREMIVAALNGLPGIRCATPGGAFYTFPNVSGTGYNARTFQSRLLDAEGVATIAGTSFGAFGEDYIRFSYANSLEAITEAIERIRRFLGNRPRGGTVGA